MGSKTGIDLTDPVRFLPLTITPGLDFETGSILILLFLRSRFTRFFHIQAVTAAAYGFDVNRPARVLLDRLAQPAHVHVQ